MDGWTEEYMDQFLVPCTEELVEDEKMKGNYISHLQLLL